MKKTNIKLITRQAVFAVVGLATMLVYFPAVASAEQITTRSVVIGDSTPSALTTYNFTFTAAQATTIKSVSFAGCTTASGACTPASGFVNPNASTLSSSSNLGSGGTWTVSTGTTGELRMSNTSNTGAPSAGITANFSNVKNPSTADTTFYIRITTYSADNWTSPIDTGTVAASTASSVTVTANVNEALTFTVGSTTVAMGTLTSGTTGSGTSTLAASTNASGGYSIGYTGTTLTSGGNTIDALTAGGTSATNNEQFGINLMNNDNPNVGAAAVGGTPQAGYGTVDSFKFVTTGEKIAEHLAPAASDSYTVSYIANIAGNTAPGAYTANINYVATANF